MTAQEKKQELRCKMLKKRSALLPEYIKNTETKAVPEIIEFLQMNAAAEGAPGARKFTVMSYMSYRNEFPTHELNKKIIDAGYRLVLPYTDSNFNIIPCIIDSLDDLTPSKLGIPEPVTSRCAIAELHDIDIILMPGVAFDKAGNRIGFGKGCYDRFIASGSVQCTDKSGNSDTQIPLLTALAYDFQIVDNIPSEPTDIPCDAIITENGIRFVAATAIF